MPLSILVDIRSSSRADSYRQNRQMSGNPASSTGTHVFLQCTMYLLVINYNIISGRTFQVGSQTNGNPEIRTIMKLSPRYWRMQLVSAPGGQPFDLLLRNVVLFQSIPIGRKRRCRLGSPSQFLCRPGSLSSPCLSRHVLYPQFGCCMRFRFSFM